MEYVSRRLILRAHGGLILELLLAGLGTCQSNLASQTTAFLKSTPSGCGNCYVEGATAAPSSIKLSGFSTLTADQSLPSTTENPIVFTAYSVISESLSERVCVTTSEEPITLETPYSVIPPTSVASSDYQRAAGSSLNDYLGFSSCRGSSSPLDQAAFDGNVSSARVELLSLFSSSPTSTAVSSQPSAPFLGNGTSVSVLSSSVVSSSPTPTAVASQPSAPTHPAQPHLDSKAKAGVGISVPIALAGLAFLGFFVWRKFHKGSIVEEIDEKTENAEISQPYLQRKAELEAEEKGKHEVEAEERRYELDGEGEIYELYAGASQAKAPNRTRQELRGEEHSNELEAPRGLLEASICSSSLTTRRHLRA